MNPQPKPTTLAADALEAGRRNLLRIGRNAASIFTSHLVLRASSLVLTILLTRYLGAFKFGQLSLGLTLFQIFQIIATAGLRTLITREVAKNRGLTNRYFVNATAVVVVSSIITGIVAYGFIWSMQYAADTTTIVLLVVLGLFPYALSQVCEGIFQAWERMHYIAYANVPASMAKVGLAFVLLWQGYDILHIVLLILALHVFVLLVEWTILFKCILRPTFKLDVRFSIDLVKATAPFLGIQAFHTIQATAGVLILSKFATEAEVGLYHAASSLMVPLYMVFNNLVESIFPVMCRKYETGIQNLLTMTESLIEFLVSIALPAAASMFLLATPILLLVYGGNEFQAAGPTLQILAWVPLLDALKTIAGQVLWASGQEKVVLRICLVNAVVMVLAGLLLIHQFGLMGVALSITLVALLNFFQHYFPVAKLLPALSLPRVIVKPCLAMVIMALTLAFLPSPHLLFTLTIACILYSLTLLGILTWSAGGLPQLRAHYLKLWA